MIAQYDQDCHGAYRDNRDWVNYSAQNQFQQTREIF